MIRRTINEDWLFVAHPTLSFQSIAPVSEAAGTPVCLPHDAMLAEPRSADVPSQNQSGFYPGGIYCYQKKLHMSADERERRHALEFEGAMKNATVYVNGALAAAWHNGYTETVVPLDDLLCYNAENIIKVFVNNASQPASRWYSGSGLYRNVNLLTGGLTHFSADGIRTKTLWLDEQLGTVQARMTLVNEQAHPVRARLEVTLSNEAGTVYRDALELEMLGASTETLIRTLQIHRPASWSCDSPALYRLCATLTTDDAELDREECSIGLRTLVADGSRGLLLNNRPIKLRGACLHHDNGILGACAFPEAEARRIRLLKQAGFNCIRSAHNPCSRTMLDACDRLGMLVMEDYTDMWTVPKTAFDDASVFLSEWRDGLRAMVRKDINHPSVILYCMGNEIPEAGSAAGAWLCRQMDTFVKQLDDSRLTLNATSGMLACIDRLNEVVVALTQQMSGDGRVLDDEQQSSEMDGVSKLNSFASILEGPLGDEVWKHPLITELLAPYLHATDITGTNYMPSRYALDGASDRLVLGTEEFPPDIARLWGLVQASPNVIGDMTWTGYDYLGEAGIGIFYYDGTVNFAPHWPDRLAYIGDIDIIGNRRTVSYYREVVYGLRKAPYMAVKRMDRPEAMTGKTPWMFTDTIASWTWRGFEGETAHADVYCDASEVELTLNDQTVGVAACGGKNRFTASFELPYAPGILKAYALRDGKRCEETALETAKESVLLCVEPEQTAAQVGGLLFLPISLRDQEGALNRQEARRITVSVEGDGVLQAIGSAAPGGEDAYTGDSCLTYDGQALAVLRANRPGSLVATLCMEGGDPVVLTFPIVS